MALLVGPVLSTSFFIPTPYPPRSGRIPGRPHRIGNGKHSSVGVGAGINSKIRFDREAKEIDP